MWNLLNADQRNYAPELPFGMIGRGVRFAPILDLSVGCFEMPVSLNLQSATDSYAFERSQLLQCLHLS
eukprot:3519018-Amphidinium_carterae.1